MCRCFQVKSAVTTGLGFTGTVQVVVSRQPRWDWEQATGERHARQRFICGRVSARAP
jgi:hypothetical protein